MLTRTEEIQSFPTSKISKVSVNKNFLRGQFDLQTKIWRGVQRIVNFDASDNCRLYVKTMKAIDFPDYISSNSIDNFKDHYMLVFELNSMLDATEKF